MIKLIIKIVALSVLTVASVSSQEKQLTVKLEGMQFDSLFIFGSTNDDEKIKIAGLNMGEEWQFTIPDTIYNTLPYFWIIPQTFDYEKKITYSIFFSYIDKEDTLLTRNCYFGDTNMIYAKFHEKKVFDNER
ncbi:MAG: hypothetical protein LBE91_18645, partial [Tannerella sp.]|nr:hypothetical protein [Tannerella sp.]